MRKPGDVTLTASVDHEDITIIRDVVAGISGPWGSFPLPGKRFTTDEIAAVLAANEYKVIGEWRAVVAYDGIRLEAEIIENHRPVILPDVVEWNAS